MTKKVLAWIYLSCAIDFRTKKKKTVLFGFDEKSKQSVAQITMLNQICLLFAADQFQGMTLKWKNAV